VNFLTENEFRKFKDIIYKASGISFSDINRPILESRVKERLRIKGLHRPLDYFDLVSNNSQEMRILLDSVTTNLTKFFRNVAHFDELKETVIPEIQRRKRLEGEKRIKIWSAGCSTGEEPYSIAITLLEVIRDFHSWDIEIIASEISFKSLLAAQEGYYSGEKLENINKNYLTKYFEPKKDGYTIKGYIKKFIRFDYHNLMNDNGERDVDIIFCRNVIIYFDKAMQKKVMTRFFDCINVDGYLFIGHAESLFGMNTGFKFKKVGNACLYRKM
jgi:chemotaxis protein methyltransferase CheR